MSTPENTDTDTGSSNVTDRETSARARRDKLTTSVGRTLEPTEQKAPWWKRLLGRS